jgi:hypothetical protein
MRNSESEETKLEARYESKTTESDEKVVHGLSGEVDVNDVQDCSGLPNDDEKNSEDKETIELIGEVPLSGEGPIEKAETDEKLPWPEDSSEEKVEVEREIPLTGEGSADGLKKASEGSKTTEQTPEVPMNDRTQESTVPTPAWKRFCGEISEDDEEVGDMSEIVPEELDDGWETRTTMPSL